MVSSSNPIPTEKLWNLVVLEAQNGAHDFMLWMSRMGDVERVVGLCLFTLILMCLMVRPRKHKPRKAKTSHEFTYALIIVMIFAFGIGWAFDSQLDVDAIMRKLF